MDKSDFKATMTSRMHVGRAEYGDGSFLKPNERIIGELMEEAQDLVGWAYILREHVSGPNMDDTLGNLPAFLERVWECSEGLRKPETLDEMVATTGVLTLRSLSESLDG